MRCRLLHLVLDALGWTVARLPARAVPALGRALTALAWPLLRSRRRIAATNLALCFPELDAAARRRLVRESVANAMTGVLELLRAWYLPARALPGLCRVEGVEHLRAALAQGRGVLLLTGHFVSYELALRLLGGALGRPVRLLARGHNNPCLDRWIETARQRVSGPTLPKKHGREPLLETLRAGEPVGYLGDQDFSYRHVFVPFFGVPAATLAATAELARDSGAVALPLWCRREADSRHVLRIDPPWDGWPSGDAAADAARYMAELERAVREAPGQYLWVHRRFKTRPPGEPPVY